ncbi:MAG TPA: carbonic anhydrase [Acidimicrobiia bacterium]|jgi:carbonic anhydrase|nr:carbonic anhydrase [Acidimicrobiia bacterium]
MSLSDELIAANARYVEHGFPGARPLRPRRALAIVACMDSRMDLFALLGLEVGDAHVLRNGGGVITDDVIRSLAISQRKLGTKGIVLVHHTDCGMTKLRDDEFASELEAATGERPGFAIEAFQDADASVRESIARLQRSPFVVSDDVAGFVFDVETGRIRPVA